MDVGLLLITTTRTGHLPELARQAEQVGFESLWIPDRPVIPVGFQTQSQFVTMPFVDPRGAALTTDFHEACADAGAKRIALFSQQMAVEIADVAAADWIERAAGIVERPRAL